MVSEALHLNGLNHIWRKEHSRSQSAKRYQLLGLYGTEFLKAPLLELQDSHTIQLLSAMSLNNMDWTMLFTLMTHKCI